MGDIPAQVLSLWIEHRKVRTKKGNKFINCSVVLLKELAD